MEGRGQAFHVVRQTGRVSPLLRLVCNLIFVEGGSVRKQRQSSSFIAGHNFSRLRNWMSTQKDQLLNGEVNTDLSALSRTSLDRGVRTNLTKNEKDMVLFRFN